MISIRVMGEIAVVAALVAGGSYVYRSGINAELSKFQSYKLKQEADLVALDNEYRAKEQALSATNQKVMDNYDALKSATALSVGAANADRLRLSAQLAAQLAAQPSAARSSAPTGPGVDVAAEVGILQSCLQEYTTVAADADALSDQLAGLQSYVLQVAQPGN